MSATVPDPSPNLLEMFPKLSGDESLIAQFEVFAKEILDPISTESCNFQKAIDDQWTDLAERRAFVAWLALIRKDPSANIPEDPVRSREELVRMIDSTKYTDGPQHWDLRDALSHPDVPWLPAGTDAKGQVYRIFPRKFGLCPSAPQPDSTGALRYVQRDMLGAIIAPSNKRNVNESGISSSSETGACTSSIPEFGDEGEKFPIYEIGDLEYFLGEVGDIDKDDYEGCWWPTGFVVVMRFEPTSGEAKGLYVVYDMNPPDDITSSISRFRRRRSEMRRSEWGRLPGEGNTVQFYMAKIADKMADLKVNRVLKFVEEVDHPVLLITLFDTAESVFPWGRS